MSTENAADGRIAVALVEDAATFRRNAAAWNALVEACAANTVFLRSEWLLACAETFAAGDRLVVPMVYLDARLVGAAAFQVRGRQIWFLGQERADYCDVMVAEELDDGLAATVVDRVLHAALAATSGRHDFWLRHVPERSRMLRVLRAGESASGEASHSGGEASHIEGEASHTFHATVKGVIEAPAMDMAVVEEKLRKKSLRRHENGLRRSGELRFETLTGAGEIRPSLDEFFAQHVSRWAERGSLFETQANRDFYRRMIDEFDGTGLLRFSRLTLDDRLVAAHLGFLHGGCFTWYKPTFDVTMARKSPGEVLLKATLEHARDAGAREFDFTIGDEGYKLRFATEVRRVYDLHVTHSRLRAVIQRLRSRLKTLLERPERPAVGAAVPTGGVE